MLPSLKSVDPFEQYYILLTNNSYFERTEIILHLSQAKTFGQEHVHNSETLIRIVWMVKRVKNAEKWKTSVNQVEQSTL